MADLTITLKSSQLYEVSMNEKGELCNAYSPLQNLVDEDSRLLGDFTTDKLNFDLLHPVDIILLDSYDGAVNMIINDGKNNPKLVNSRFSVLNDTQFLIPDHTGYKDTNIYDELEFKVDTALKAISRTIPNVSLEKIVNNAGSLSCGAYTFYFKLSDVDGNETEVVQESGIVLMYIGDINDPTSIRMGLEDENTKKAILLKLTNIDSGFDYVHVLFSKNSSAEHEKMTTTYYKIVQDFPIVDKTCEIYITGKEQILPITENEIYTDFADIDAVKTQTVNSNVLLFGNIKALEHDWDALRKMSWKILPSCDRAPNVGYINSEYSFNKNKYHTTWDPSKLKTKVNLSKLQSYNSSDNSEEYGYAYYNPKNTYYKVGYWPDEIYRFGVVYIFEDMSLSPVFNIQGVDFSKFSEKDPLKWEDLFERNSDNSIIEHDFDPEDHIFDEKYLLNSKGVIKFPRVPNYIVGSGECKPNPLYIKFDLSHIGEGISNANETPTPDQPDAPKAEDMFKFHKIKGLFFVRQKRVPTIFALGMMVGLTHKDLGAIPVILKTGGKYTTLSFLSKHGLLMSEGTTIEAAPKKQDLGSNQSEYLVKVLAMLVPDAEMNTPLFNDLFVGNKYALDVIGKSNVVVKDDAETDYNVTRVNEFEKLRYHHVTLLNVPEDTKTISDGKTYFSTTVGNPSEPYKTADVLKVWRKTLPQNLTESTSVIRGKWGSFVGVSLVDDELGLNYGDIVNIKEASYIDLGEEVATKLDFQKRFNIEESYNAICDRIEVKNLESICCYRGDCFTGMFTHRMLRNFIDPELPTNTQIIDPNCWASNYGVRCTASILTNTHSNLTSDSDGWYIDTTGNSDKNMLVLIYFLTGNIIGAIMLLASGKEDDDPSHYGLADSYAYYDGTNWKTSKRGASIKINNDSEVLDQLKDKKFYLIENIVAEDSSDEIKLSADLVLEENPKGKKVPIAWDENNLNLKYPNGFANEICQSFETYVGGAKSKDKDTSIWTMALKYGLNGKPYRKKVNPKLQEKDSGGLNLKAIFKSDDNWELHGIASINRADVNAVGLGQWITFPINSSHNLALRDVDYQQPTEEASFARKRSFYPLVAKDLHNPLPDATVINESASLSTPNKMYLALPNVPFTKLEFFNRVHASLHDSSSSIANEFKIMLQNAYSDYTKVYGSITKLVTLGNYTYIIFSHGIGVIGINLQSKNVLSYLPEDVTILDSSVGSIWKDSICCTDHCIYGVDTVAKKIWQIVGDKVKAISDHVVGKFLIDHIDTSEFTNTPYIGHINVKTHYNAFKHDVMFTYYNDTFRKKQKLYDDESYTIDDEGYICQGGIRCTDGDNGPYILAQKIESEDFNSSEDTDIIDLIKNKKGRWVPGTLWSLCYNEVTLMFTTFYDWIPVESENIDNIYFSFDKELTNELYEKDPAKNLISWDVPYFYRTIKKFNMDLGFANKVSVYNVDRVDGTFYLVPGTLSVISFYYRCNEDISFKVRNGSDGKTLKATYTDDSDKQDGWRFASIFILDISKLKTKVTEPFIIEKSSTEEGEINFEISELKQIILDSTQYNDILHLLSNSLINQSAHPYRLLGYCFDFLHLDFVGDDKKEIELIPSVDYFWEIRNSQNNVKLWKHGLAGIYDNQGKIKPTHWYGKQHEFNFEFVVTEKASYLKIFDNLKMISNKTAPNKFQYEVVGEGYEWYELKLVIGWINKTALKGTETIDELYVKVLSNSLNWLHNTYQDFPALFNKPSEYIIPKLPYLKMKWENRLGTKNYPEFINKDPETNLSIEGVDPDTYKDNSSETILIYDELLNEYKIRTESLANDIKKYGRTRGNMEYLEDLWDIEIRPIYFKYAYVEDGKLKLSELQETRHRDKYMRVKIKYTGEDLALIASIFTLFNRSYA